MVSMVTAAFCAKPCATWSSRARHHLLQAGGELGEFVVHVLGLEIEAGGQPVAGRGDGGGGVVAGGFQPVEQGCSRARSAHRS